MSSTIETIERNELFDLAFRFVTETNENIFLTGKAGTGKTTFLKYLKDNCTKNIVVSAPTGVAAINAGGVTLHSLFQLPFHPFLPTKTHSNELLGKIRLNKQRQQLLCKMELLVIDEISMVRCDVMDAIDTILKSVRRNYDLPFGGVQLLCIGDLHQLPPVAQSHEWSILSEYYPSPFFFDSLAVKTQMPLLIELDKIYRQKEGSFVRLLNKIRTNNMDQGDFEDLNLLYQPGFIPADDEKYITLSTHNKQAELINQQQLNRIIAPATTYHAVVEREFAEQLFPADAALALKVGAQVMFLKNDTILKRYYNGKIGTVSFLNEETITVDCDGLEINVSPEKWENSRYTLNQKDGIIEQEVLGTFSQYPLRLAWAITIHKSQGLTFEKVMIDAGAAFSSGQVYVALSRCTSLEGVVLLSKIPATAIYSSDHVIKAQESLAHRGSLAERFEGARKLFTLQLLEELFSFGDALTAARQIDFYLQKESERLTKEMLEWGRCLLHMLLKEQSIGIKFGSEASLLLKSFDSIEENELLQKRIKDAAHYFGPRFREYIKMLNQHPITAEHKETSSLLAELLTNLHLALYRIEYFLQYCQQSFLVTGYLQHKLKFQLPKFQAKVYAGGKREISADVPNSELFETLKSWRDMVCEENKLPIYMLANKATLTEISTFLPHTKKDLLRVTGFGKAKTDRYGDDVIDLVKTYCEEHNLESRMHEKNKVPAVAAVKKSDALRPDSKQVSFELFKNGMMIPEIAEERKLTIGTIQSHFIEFLESGTISIKDLVNDSKLHSIEDAILIHGTQSAKLLRENLPESISYGEIRMVMASKRYQKS